MWSVVSVAVKVVAPASSVACGCMTISRRKSDVYAVACNTMPAMRLARLVGKNIAMMIGNMSASGASGE